METKLNLTKKLDTKSIIIPKKIKERATTTMDDWLKVLPGQKE